MNVLLTPSLLEGDLRVIPSKSYMHRALICASLADRPTVLHCPQSNRDIWATAGCLSALGAEIREENGVYTVFPIVEKHEKTAHLCCEESGSTLRFMLPVTAALGRKATFYTKGRLSQRPLSPLYEELVRHGVTLSENGVFPLSVEGQLTGGEFALEGSVSSQFFTGLLLGLPLLSEESKITVLGRLESAPYVALTCAVMKEFGVEPVVTEQEMHVSPASFRSPGELFVEGDWSNAAFWLVAGVIGGKIRLTGLQKESTQGDKAVVTLLQEMGGNVREEKGVYLAEKSVLHGVTIDAADIPDLVPILAIAAAYAEGETVIKGAARLRLKESDRIASVCGMLKALGAPCEETADGMIIQGGGLTGGIVDACNDHRIAMSGAVASLVCKEPVTILGGQAVEKSYPDFFRHLESLGGVYKELN